MKKTASLLYVPLVGGTPINGALVGTPKNSLLVGKLTRSLTFAKHERRF